MAATGSGGGGRARRLGVTLVALVSVLGPLAWLGAGYVAQREALAALSAQARARSEGLRAEAWTPPRPEGARWTWAQGDAAALIHGAWESVDAAPPPRAEVERLRRALARAPSTPPPPQADAGDEARALPASCADLRPPDEARGAVLEALSEGLCHGLLTHRGRMRWLDEASRAERQENPARAWAATALRTPREPWPVEPLQALTLGMLLDGWFAAARGEPDRALDAVEAVLRLGHLLGRGAGAHHARARVVLTDDALNTLVHLLHAQPQEQQPSPERLERLRATLLALHDAPLRAEQVLGALWLRTLPPRLPQGPTTWTLPPGLPQPAPAATPSPLDWEASAALLAAQEAWAPLWASLEAGEPHVRRRALLEAVGAQVGALEPAQPDALQADLLAAYHTTRLRLVIVAVDLHAHRLRAGRYPARAADVEALGARPDLLQDAISGAPLGVVLDGPQPLLNPAPETLDAVLATTLEAPLGDVLGNLTVALPR